MTAAREILSFTFNPSDFGSLGQAVIHRETQQHVKAQTETLISIANGNIGSLSSKEQDTTLCLFHKAYNDDTLKVVFSSHRRLKRLAYCLTTETEDYPAIITSDEKLVAALSLLKSQKGAKVSWGLFIAALNAWAMPAARSSITDVLESRLVSAPALRIHQLLTKNRQFILSQNGAESYAEYLLKNGELLRSSMSKLGLPESLHASHYGLVLAYRCAVGAARSYTKQEALVRWTADRQSKDYALAVLPPLILNATAETREELEKTALALIGDPGILYLWSSNNAALRNQEKAIESARLVVQGWLSKRLIKLFFSKLQVNDDDRRKFWAQWAKHISDIRIAVDTKNRRLLFRSEELAEYLKTRVIRMGGQDSTALIMKIKDRVIVEIGDTGNALYVYPANGVSYMNAKSVTSSQLKRQVLPLLYRSTGYNIYNVNHHGRAIHRFGWQTHVQAWMRRELNIEPG